MAKKHTAKNLFELNIYSAEECIEIYDGLEKLDTNLNTSWLLRAAVVFTVSALDAYFHDKIRYRVGRYKFDNLPTYLKEFQIRLGDVTKIEQAERKGNVLKNIVTEYYGRRPLQNKDDIKKALRLVEIEDVWTNAAKKQAEKKPGESFLTIREEWLSTLSDLVKRRNQIAHEGDRKSARNSGKELRDIKREEVRRWIDFAKEIVQAIEELSPD